MKRFQSTKTIKDFEKCKNQKLEILRKQNLKNVSVLLVGIVERPC